AATRRTSSGPIRPDTSADPDLDVAEPGGAGPMADPRRLARLTLAAVRRPPHRPPLAAADGVARSPEPRGDPGVVGVPVELAQLAVLDPPCDLAAELEVHALVVDRPRVVRRQVDPVLRVPDDLRERALPGLE